MKVNNKEYQIKEGEITVLVGETGNLVPYGWSVECRFNGGSWFTYWTNSIYSSKQSALNAIIQIPKTNREEYRVIPLYKMEGYALRDYKISEILGETKSNKQKLNEIKAWKLKKDFEYPFGSSNPDIIKKGSVFIQMENGTIIKSGQTEKTRYFWRDIEKYLSDKDFFEDIELKDEKWLYPHLLKEIKNKL